MTESLEAKFRLAEQDPRGSYVRVDPVRAYDLFVGSEAGSRSLLLICERPCKLPDQYESFEIRQGLREDGRWALTVTLASRSLSTLFCRLAEDLIDVSAAAPSGDAAAGMILQRLQWWHRMLTRASSGLMATDALRGLAGELHILEQVVLPQTGIGPAISAWRGPFEAPKDFVFGDCEIEVKTIRRGASHFDVSSAQQLEDTGVPLHVVLVELEPATADLSGAFSVAALVATVRAACAADADAMAAFNAALKRVGYGDDEEYSQKYFVVGDVTWYDCRVGFPRIVPAVLPDGVLRCSYALAIPKIAGFRTTVWTAIR